MCEVLSEQSEASASEARVKLSSDQESIYEHNLTLTCISFACLTILKFFAPTGLEEPKSL